MGLVNTIHGYIKEICHGQFLGFSSLLQDSSTTQQVLNDRPIIFIQLKLTELERSVTGHIINNTPIHRSSFQHVVC
jgi:hypothetical protein